MLHRATVERRLRVTCHIAHDPDPAAHSRQLADRGAWRRRVQGYLNKRRWEQKITSAIPLCRARDSNPDPKSRRASNSLTARAAPVQGSLAIGHLGFDGGVVAPPSEEAILCTTERHASQRDRDSDCCGPLPSGCGYRSYWIAVWSVCARWPLLWIRCSPLWISSSPISFENLEICRPSLELRADAATLD